MQEEIDYKNYSKVDVNSTMTDIKKESSNNTSLNSKYSVNAERRDFKIVEVQCIFNKQSHDGNINLITVRSHLGEKMRPGDIFLGKSLTKIKDMT